MQDFRVIDLPERTTLDSSDYVMIDSAENGTNKYLLSRQAAEIAQQYGYKFSVYGNTLYIGKDEE